MKTIKTPPLETGGWEEDFDKQFESCNGGDAVCATINDDGLSTMQYLKGFIRNLISHTNASVTEQTARETILELLSLMQAMPINERMGMPRHLVAIDLHKYAKSKGISLSEPLEKE